MRYFLHIGYDGTNYSGWQIQVNASSIQESIENALEQIFKKKITVFGCGRTDKGVHASQYIAHINIYEDIDFDLKYRLNKNLPDDIVVFDFIPMKDGQHARFDATSRTYDYFIHCYDDPVLKRYSSYYKLDNLDFEAMKSAVTYLTQYDDFHSLCKQPNSYPNTICNISKASLFISKDKQRLRFTIKANRFLKGMVRICMTYLLKIGKGEMSVEEFDSMVCNRIIPPLDSMAFPNGLYLSEVSYPYLNLSTQEGICSFLKTGLT